MQNMQDRLIKQLDDARAMERAHGRMLDESIGTVKEPDVRVLLERKKSAAHTQEMAIEECIRRYGNEPSNGRSMLSRIIDVFGDGVHEDGDAYDTATQALEKEFGAESYKIGVYRALGTYASLVGEKETASMAIHHLEGAREAVGEVWNMLPRVASESIEGTWAENVLEEAAPPSLGPFAEGTTVPNSMPNDMGPLASARGVLYDTDSPERVERMERTHRQGADYCGDVMTESVETVTPDATLQEAAQLMREKNIGPLPVCEGRTVVGMITDRDLAVRGVALGRDPVTTRVRDVMSTDVVCASERDRVTQAAQLMEDRQVRRLPVVDKKRQIRGIVSLGDVAVRKGDDKLSGEVLRGVSMPADGEEMSIR